MEEYNTTYNGQLRTTSVHQRSQAEIITDAPVDNHGKGESFSPTDLVANGLGTCILTIMGIEAQKHNINIEGSTARVQKFMASDPRRIQKITVDVQMPDRDYSAEEKSLLREAAKGCPVAKSLHPEVEEEIKISFER